MRVHCEFMDHFEALGVEKNFNVEVRYSSEREDWIQGMVVAEMGFAFMPEYSITVPGMVSRPLVEPTLEGGKHVENRFRAITGELHSNGDVDLKKGSSVAGVAPS